MKLHKKKIIAREFLILLGCIALTVFVGLGTIPYNYFVNLHIENLPVSTQTLIKEIHNLEKIYKLKESKQKWFYNENKKRFSEASYISFTDLWGRLRDLQKADSIMYKWDNVWDKKVKEMFSAMGLKSGSDLNRFIAEYSFSKEDLVLKSTANLKYRELDKIRNQMRQGKDLLLDAKEQTNFVLVCFLLISIIVFPIRYLFYIIKWCIKTIKQKE